MEYITPLLFKNIHTTLGFIYEESMYGDMDIFRIKDVLDSFSEGQYDSKTWACENLIQLVSSEHDECIVMGGWYGLFAMLFKKEGFDKKITSIDIDPVCKHIGDKLKYNKDISFKTIDGLTLFNNEIYNNKSKIFVCTACEHIDNDDLINLLNKKHSEMLVCLQSNNYYDIDSHINCKDSLEDFVNSLPLKKILYKGEMPWKNEYNRFMVIGR